MFQIVSITLLNLKNLPQRLGSSIVVVVGIAGVVAVLLSVLALASGFQQTLTQSASSERTIALGSGAEAEAASSISRETARVIVDSPGIDRDPEGKAIASIETLIIAPVARKSDGLDAYVTLRGMGPQGFKLRPEIKLTAGRWFTPAVRELIVGKAAAARFSGLEIGERVLLRGGEWTVVGIFDSGGSAHESTLLADAETVMAAYQLKSFNSVTATISKQTDFDSFKASLTTNPTVDVDIHREPEYVARSSKPMYRLLDLLAHSIGSIMAVGALFCALNCMFSAVNSRSVEIATLRALGFGSTAIVISVLVEALLLTLTGALTGTTIAYFAFNGRAINMIGSTSSPSQLVYQLAVTPASVGIAIAVSVLLGLIGGMLPAFRATQVPIVQGLRPR